MVLVVSLACSTGSLRLDDVEELDGGAGDSSAGEDSGACPAGAPRIEGLALGCDGWGIGAWWDLAAGAEDLRLTWSAPSWTTTTTASVDGIAGATCCGSAVLDGRSCDELEGLALAVEVLAVDGQVLDCRSTDGAACPVLDELPACEEGA